MVTINIQKKDLFLLSAIVVFLIGVGFVVAYGSGDPSLNGHDAGEIMVNIDGSSISLQEAINSGKFGLEVYDSGWFAVTGDVTYTKNHGFGEEPFMVELWFSESIDGSSGVILRSSTDYDYAPHVWANSMLSIIDVNSVDIKIRSSGPYLAMYEDSAGVSKTPNVGYARIKAIKI